MQKSLQQNFSQGAETTHYFSYVFAEISTTCKVCRDHLFWSAGYVRHFIQSCLLWTEKGKMGNKNLQKNLYSGALKYERNLKRWNSAQVRFISFNLGVYNANNFMWALWLCSHHSQQRSGPCTQCGVDPSLSTLEICGFTQLLKCKDLVSSIKLLATVASPDLCGN